LPEGSANTGATAPDISLIEAALDGPNYFTMGSCAPHGVRITIDMTKEHILSEIRRTAIANGGAPLGLNGFHAETGIKKWDWHGRYWARWAMPEGGRISA
jgi:hypothetical protein